MKHTAFMMLLMLPLGCGADAFSGADAQADRQNQADVVGGGDGDTGADGHVDGGVETDSSKPDTGGDGSIPVDAGSDACATESGNAACGRAADAYCAKAKACGGWQNIQDCRNWLNVNLNSQFDCSNGNYNKLVCKAPTDKCIGDVGQVSCSTIQTKAPDQTTPSCTSFFGQF